MDVAIVLALVEDESVIRRRTRLSASVVLAALLSTSLLAARPVLAQPAASFRDAPADASRTPNPFAGQADAVSAGRKLFRQHCAECHGSDALGSQRAPNLRTPAVATAPSGALFWFVTNGDLRRGMPAWSRIPDERRWQLVTWLRSLKAE